MDKKAIISGASGFTGAVLTEYLVSVGYEVVAIVRPNSSHNSRIDKFGKMVTVIPIDIFEDISIESIIDKFPNCQESVFFHLAWHGDRNNTEEQLKNVDVTLEMVDLANALGCKRFICTGSQAEYGPIREDIITEDTLTSPITAYGEAKVAACQLSKVKADQLGLEWIWGRIFSLIGKYEPRGRMLPDLIYKLKNNEDVFLSSCKQNWDYLDVRDASEALIALAEKGKSGEIYNIANGDYHPLKYYTELAKEMINPNGKIIYGEDPNPYVSLQPSVEKIRRDTGWCPQIDFVDTLKVYE